MQLGFRVLAGDATTSARTGELRTAHGCIETPAFMPVGTQATVKSLTPDDLTAAGAGIILGNTYHLHLRPGADLIARQGGLHAFMAWGRPILTDSGGFQVFSLGHLRELDDEGVTFRSHIDGSLHRFTPESVVRIQEELGSDIAMVLDECTSYPATEEEARRSAERTVVWAERAREVHRRSDQVLFGIVQGGMHAELRRESAARLVALDFPGYGIGGLSVGEPKPLFYEMMAVSAGELPDGKPRYVMGVGAPEDLFEAVASGIDMFDCVLQTRLGRNGVLLTRAGRINIRNARFREDSGPADPWCDCYACRTFSLAYLHHLFRAEELLAYRLASLHNVRWTIKLVEEMRTAIRAGTFGDLRATFLTGYTPPNTAVRKVQRERWLASRATRPSPPDMTPDSVFASPTRLPPKRRPRAPD
jgi:queuine tRNA-ribosyltransferase